VRKVSTQTSEMRMESFEADIVKSRLDNGLLTARAEGYTCIMVPLEDMGVSKYVLDVVSAMYALEGFKAYVDRAVFCVEPR
jgi:hypothetical protein